MNENASNAECKQVFFIIQRIYWVTDQSLVLPKIGNRIKRRFGKWIDFPKRLKVFDILSD